IYYSDEVTEGATNESGFTGLPAGWRTHGTGYLFMGEGGYFWSSSEYSSLSAYRQVLSYYDSQLVRYSNSKQIGSSIRCLEGADEDLVVDCAGVPGGSATEDNCGTCDSDNSNNCVQDCNGDWGGNDFNSCVIDIDGNVYETVQIGDQLWMAENLNVTHFRNGEEITLIGASTEELSWQDYFYAAYSDWNNLPPTHEHSTHEIYGRLYNWFAVDDSRGLCMEGWHVPSDGEWEILVNYLGGEDVAGSKLKEVGTTHWSQCVYEGTACNPNSDATNSSGFTGLPGGYRNQYAAYKHLGKFGYFWSSTAKRYGLYGEGSVESYCRQLNPEDT
ncbi:MAG: FISUMP domain-containing protein, partial [Anaerolineales bacterium]|nr:FISUMP domain-containing protein [Anaerolineales bacterium]